MRRISLPKSSISLFARFSASLSLSSSFRSSLIIFSRRFMSFSIAPTWSAIDFGLSSVFLTLKFEHSSIVKFLTVFLLSLCLSCSEEWDRFLSLYFGSEAETVSSPIVQPFSNFLTKADLLETRTSTLKFDSPISLQTNLLGLNPSRTAKTASSLGASLKMNWNFV